MAFLFTIFDDNLFEKMKNLSAPKTHTVNKVSENTQAFSPLIEELFEIVYRRDIHLSANELSEKYPNIPSIEFDFVKMFVQRYPTEAEGRANYQTHRKQVRSRLDDVIAGK